MNFEPQVILPMPPPPSSFVNVLAWVLIICGGCLTCITLLNNIVLSPFFTRPEVMEQSDAITKMMFSHRGYLFLLSLLSSAAMLVVGIGLLKRKNWARVTVTVIAALGILFYAAILVLLFTSLSEITNVFGGEPAAVEIQRLLSLIQVFGAMVTVFLLGFHIFIIITLCSLKIKEEFLQMNESFWGKS